MGKRYNKYNRANTCDKCKIEENIIKINKCWLKLDYHKRPDTDHNIIKSLRDRRTGNLRPNSSQAKGEFEELTCRWRGIKNLKTNYLRK